MVVFSSWEARRIRARERPLPGAGSFEIWDLATGVRLDEIATPHWIDGIDLSKDGRVLAVAAVGLHVFDVAPDKGRVRFSERFCALDQQIGPGVPIFQEQFRHAAVSPEGAIVAGAAGSPGSLAAEAGHVALFARQDGRRIARLQTLRPSNGNVQAGAHDIDAVAFSPDGSLIASGGKERTVALWLARPAVRRPVGVAPTP